MLVVLALLIILGTIIIPSTAALYGNSRQKAGADMVRARLADGRALAMETGTQVPGGDLRRQDAHPRGTRRRVRRRRS